MTGLFADATVTSDAAGWVGLVLVALSAVLLAGHWQQWNRASSTAVKGNRLLRTVRRRSQASAVIGLIGMAFSAFDALPKSPGWMTAYLLLLLLLTGWLLVLAFLDAASAQHENAQTQIDRVAAQLRESKLRLPKNPQVLTRRKTLAHASASHESYCSD